MTNRFTANDRFEYQLAESEKLKVGEQIELGRDDRPYTIDDEGEMPAPPKYRWERVEVEAILPRAEAGNLVFEVKHADGHTSRIVPVMRWRRFCSG